MTVPASRPDAPECLSPVRIEKLVPEGKGLARLPDGRVVLAEGVVPGDTIQIEEATVTRSLVRVERWALVEPSPQRVEPVCEVWEECGGCDWIAVSAEQQSLSKSELVKEALRRTGGLAEDSERTKPCLQGEMLNYRSRVRLHIVDGRLGFYARGSHRLVEPSECAVSRPALNEAFAPLRAELANHPKAAALFESVEIRECSEGLVSLSFSPRKPTEPARFRHRRAHVGGRTRNRRPQEKGPSSEAIDKASATLRQALPSSYVVVSSEAKSAVEQVWQRFFLPDGGVLFSAPGGFTQVHWSMNQRLVQEVIRGAVERGARTFLDLYSGAGNFTLPLLKAGLSGTAVEGSALSVAAARRGVQEQGSAASAEFIEGDVGRTVKQLADNDRLFDLVLIDPPRAGIHSGLLEMVQLCQSWILLCSCNPVTLARDLRKFVDAGCTIESIQPLDLFPQTHHVETLVWLKGNGAEPKK